ncbi:hypothetical protein ACCO45_000278 [Purpureocillium lilacinum]|uniref:Uncharacterized protein n=1 Tax=Purpureocillium lilacinum TaxID=33203 RepID=A0ACC4E3R3_PURLI
MQAVVAGARACPPTQSISTAVVLQPTARDQSPGAGAPFRNPKRRSSWPKLPVKVKSSPRSATIRQAGAPGTWRDRFEPPMAPKAQHRMPTQRAKQWLTFSAAAHCSSQVTSALYPSTRSRPAVHPSESNEQNESPRYIRLVPRPVQRISRLRLPAPHVASTIRRAPFPDKGDGFPSPGSSAALLHHIQTKPWILGAGGSLGGRLSRG